MNFSCRNLDAIGRDACGFANRHDSDACRNASCSRITHILIVLCEYYEHEHGCVLSSLWIQRLVIIHCTNPDSPSSEG